MSREIQDLHPDFREKPKLLLRKCSNDGAEMRPFWTLRDPYTQAKFYRQSRCWEEILDKVEYLRSEEAFFIAEVLLSVGPQYGRWATNALPGESTHNYGYAIDCYSLEPGIHSRYIINWTKMNPYKIYAHYATELGLIAGYYWKSKDVVHVQDKGFRIPKTWIERDHIMKEKFCIT